MIGTSFFCDGNMVKPDLKQTLPTGAELPCSEDAPVNNEDQNFIPNFLLFLQRLVFCSGYGELPHHSHQPFEQ